MTAELEPKPDNELQIIDVDDTGKPESGTPEITVVTEPVVASPTHEDTVESLRSQLAAERAAKTAETQRAEAATREATQFRTEADTQRYAAISRALEAQSAAVDQAEGAYATAMESGDFKAAAKAQTALSKAVAAQQTLETGKAQMDAMRADPRYRQQPQRPAEPTFDQRISGMSSATQTWLRAHPDAITDVKQSNKVMSAHHAALADGIAPDSREYFDFIEQQAGYKAKPPPQPNAPAQPQRQAMASTPVNGQARAPGGRQLNGNQFHMTPKMREAAKISGVTPVEYAKQVQQGLNDGEDWAIELTRVN